MTPTSAAPVTNAALLTADEFAARYGDHRVELVEGVVKECPILGSKHGKVCMTIGALLFNHVEAHDLGHVMSNDT